MTQSIAGQSALEPALPHWIDAQGRERSPLTLKELGGRHRFSFFRFLCGGYHSHRFPTLQSLVQNPRTKDLEIAAAQNAFESAYVNTRDKLPFDQ